MRNEAGLITEESADITKIIRKYDKQLYTHTFENPYKMGHFPEKYKLPQHTQHSIEI
jgi:N-formylglutamate amidohydrolase